VDIILFEGWCVGSQPISEQALAEPVNELEQTHDASGAWRRFVNTQLGGDYQALFATLDALVFMAVPDFDCVRRWRTEQEHKLRAAHGKGDDRGSAQGMNDDQVAEFVQYFERITRDNLAVLPRQADVVLRLGQDHQLVSADYRS
jgi:D-glycerate 3-kinase